MVFSIDGVDFDSYDLLMVGEMIVKIDLVIVVQCVISMIDDIYEKVISQNLSFNINQIA